jgi:hypothetical protein
MRTRSGWPLKILLARFLRTQQCVRHPATPQPPFPLPSCERWYLPVGDHAVPSSQCSTNELSRIRRSLMTAT